MILERKMQLDIRELSKQFIDIKRDFIDDESFNPETRLFDFAHLIQIYNGAMKEVSTKLEVLDDEFHVRYRHNPIHHLECRIKGVRSIYEKIRRSGGSFTMDFVREHVQDIAGIRVICNYIDDIYAIEKQLLRQTDVTLCKRKNYIKEPKANGYRSLHLIVRIPVFLNDKTENVPVEIQMRTVAMDYWASLEHMLRYKNSVGDTRQFEGKLLECANALAETEKTMQEIRNGIEGIDRAILFG